MYDKIFCSTLSDVPVQIYPGNGALWPVQRSFRHSNLELLVKQWLLILFLVNDGSLGILGAFSLALPTFVDCAAGSRFVKSFTLAINFVSYCGWNASIGLDPMVYKHEIPDDNVVHMQSFWDTQLPTFSGKKRVSRQLSSSSFHVGLLWWCLCFTRMILWPLVSTEDHAVAEFRSVCVDFNTWQIVH